MTALGTLEDRRFSDVQLTANPDRRAFTNHHTYSDYRLFRVESVIKP